MDLDEIRALLAVAESGSFVNAARATTMTRSTLRRKVDELEARIGRPLFERTAQGARLTATGEMVAREGRLVVEHARAMLNAARTTHPGNNDPVTIVVPQGLPTELVALAHRMLSERLPHQRIDLEFSENPRASLVENADIALALCSDCPEGPWEGIAIRQVRECLLASEEYAANMGLPATVAELAHHRLAVWRPPAGDGTQLPLRGGGYVRVEPQLITSDIHLLHTTAGLGATLVYAPDAMFGPVLPSMRALIPVLSDVVGLETTAWLIAPSALGSSPHVRAIVELVRRLLTPAEP